MEFFVRLNKSLLLLAFVGGLVLGGGSAKADFIWGPPTNLGPAINSSSTDAAPNISADGLSLYFSSNRPGGFGGWEIYVATRASISDPWEPAVNLGPTINSSAHESHTSISADELSLYFAEGPFFDISPRPGGFGGSDIWVASRATTSDPWETPVNLGNPVNTGANEGGPTTTCDGLILLFDSDRPGGSGGLDLWMTTRPTVSDPWGSPVNLGPIVNSSSIDAVPNISADGLTLFFMSNRTGDYDIWATTRPSVSDHFATPVNLGSPVNTSTIEATPCISADGFTLLFLSRRAGGYGGDDLWQVSIEPVVDFNGDGRINFKDFCELARYWSADESSVDIAPLPLGDHRVDYKDLAVFTDYWLSGNPPDQASNPHPANYTEEVDINVDLSWTVGAGATSYDVYFGTSSPGTFRGNQTAAIFDPGTMTYLTKYYWRIDEVGAYGTTTSTVWSFTTMMPPPPP